MARVGMPYVSISVEAPAACSPSRPFTNWLAARRARGTGLRRRRRLESTKKELLLRARRISSTTLGGIR